MTSTIVCEEDEGESVENFWYLFAAYTVVWTALFAYVVHLSKRNRELQEELRDLQARVDESRRRNVRK